MKKKLLLMPLLCLPFLLTSCDLGIQKNVINEVVVTEGDEVEAMRIKNTITDVYKAVYPSCIGIYASSETEASTGSGVIYKYEDGYYYFVTNHHVIKGKTEFKVYDGESIYYNAILVGSDATNDIAVLKFSTDILEGKREFKSLDIFDAALEDVPTVGQTVVAIGCPLDIENYNSVSQGIVSRYTLEKITTDAALNPGNSGGGLFNLEGRLVGIVNSGQVWTSTEDGNIPVEGEGYAISIYIVKACIKDIEAKQKEITRPLMGIRVFTVNTLLKGSNYEKVKDYLPEGEGEYSYVVVDQVTKDSPASKAGFKANDVVLEINDKKITKTNDIGEILHVTNTEDTLSVKVYRNGKIETLTVSFE